MTTDLSFDAPAQQETGTPGSTQALLVAFVAGAAVSLAIGAYGRVHTPTGQGIVSFGFPAVLPMKAWFTTGAGALALFQMGSALWMYGKLPGAGATPSWLGAAHRWSGTAAFLLTLPVAYHCLWSLGFQDSTGRVLTHSMLGCMFYGIFTTKMLVLHSKRVPDWALPFAGAALVVVLVGIWLTSSLWFFQNFGFPGV